MIIAITIIFVAFLAAVFIKRTRKASTAIPGTLFVTPTREFGRKIKGERL